jgi:hypothetical protein
MQTIATATCRRVVYGEVQVVSPEKPLESAPGLCVPAFSPSDTMSLQAGRDHRLRLDWLLVEAGAFAAPWIETIGADGNEVL